MQVQFGGQSTWIEPNLEKFTEAEVDKRIETMLREPEAAAAESDDSLSILATDRSKKSKLAKKPRKEPEKNG